MTELDLKDQLTAATKRVEYLEGVSAGRGIAIDRLKEELTAARLENERITTLYTSREREYLDARAEVRRLGKWNDENADHAQRFLAERDQLREEIAQLKAEKIAHLQLIDGQAEEIERLRQEPLFSQRLVPRLQAENAKLKAALAKISLGHEYSCGVNQGVLCTCRAGIAIKALEGGT